MTDCLEFESTVSVANLLVRTSVRCSRKEKFRGKVSGGSHFGAANPGSAL